MYLKTALTGKEALSVRGRLWVLNSFCLLMVFFYKKQIMARAYRLHVRISTEASSFKTPCIFSLIFLSFPFLKPRLTLRSIYL